MEYAVFKQQIMEQAKRILPQEEGYVITIVDQTEYGLGEMLIINKSDKEVVPGISGIIVNAVFTVSCIVSITSSILFLFCEKS